MRTLNAVVSILISILSGIALGVVTAILWSAGLAPFIRQMVPFVIALELIVISVTAMISAKNGYFKIGFEEECPKPRSTAIKLFTATVVISDVIAIIVALVILATYLAFLFRMIFAFVGAIAFWIALIAFVLYIIYMARK